MKAVVDRMRVRPDAAQRLAESFETALRLSGGLAQLIFLDEPERELHAQTFLTVYPHHPAPSVRVGCGRPDTSENERGREEKTLGPVAWFCGVRN